MKLQILFSILAVAAPSWSQPGGGGRRGGGPSGPCAADVQQFCADARSQGRDAVHACMREHKDQLSEACRQSIREKQSSQGGGMAEGAPAAPPQRSGPPPECKDDLKKFCEQAKGQGKDAMKACMKAHMTELSRACQDEIAKKREGKLDASAKQGPEGDADGFKAAVLRITESCANEKQLFCAGVEPKDGALMRCLMQHEGDAASDCQSALENAKPYAMRRKAAGGQ